MSEVESGERCSVCGQPLDGCGEVFEDVDALRSGARLQNGRYEIKEKIGQGGFGITYRAYDHEKKREVVVKEFFYSQYCRRDSKDNSTIVISGGKENLVSFNKAKKRAKEEAKILETINHSHIVKAYESFDENNTFYIVMEYIEGHDLKKEIRGHKDKRLPEDEALGYFRQLLKGLGAIHAIGIVHRDVKPQNILIDRERNVKLIDFGTVADIDTKSREITKIQSSGYAPKEIYMSSSALQPSYDIYSAGITLYSMLSGKVDGIPEPIGRERNDILRIEIEKELAVSETTKEVLLKCIEVEADARYQSVEEVLEALYATKPQEAVAKEKTMQEAISDYRYLLRKTKPTDKFINIMTVITFLFTISFIYSGNFFSILIKGFYVFACFTIAITMIFILVDSFFSIIPKLKEKEIQVSKEIYDEVEMYDEIYNSDEKMNSIIRYLIKDKSSNKDKYTFTLVNIEDIKSKHDEIKEAIKKIDIYLEKVSTSTFVLVIVTVILSHTIFFSGSSMFFYEDKNKLDLTKENMLIIPDENNCEENGGSYDKTTKECVATWYDAKKICDASSSFGGRLMTNDELSKIINLYFETDDKKYEEFIYKGREKGIWLNTQTSSVMKNIFNTILRPYYTISGGEIKVMISHPYCFNPKFNPKGIDVALPEGKHVVKCIDDPTNYYYEAFDNL
jgi:serine/threonine protein kinase